MEGTRFDKSFSDVEWFPPTVCEHTSYKDGYVLHTIDPRKESDIKIEK